VGGDGVITMDNDRPELGKRIRSLRDARNWSQSDLAMRVGMSPRTIGTYEREGPRMYKLGLFNAVFDGELLAGTVFDGAASRDAGTNGTASNGTKGPPRARSVAEVVESGVTEEELTAVDAHDDALASDMAADQTAVTGGVEPLGLLLDEVLARLRAVERAVVDLEKKCSDR